MILIAIRTSETSHEVISVAVVSNDTEANKVTGAVVKRVSTAAAAACASQAAALVYTS